MHLTNLFLDFGSGDAAGAALGGGMMMFQGLFGIAFYIVMAIALMTIANKTDTPNGWMAFIPILNLYLMTQIARKEWWWLLLMLIPCVNIVVLAYLWMQIAEIRDKPSWWGIMTVIPCIGFIFQLLIAFQD